VARRSRDRGSDRTRYAAGARRDCLSANLDLTREGIEPRGEATHRGVAFVAHGLHDPGNATFQAPIAVAARREEALDARGLGRRDDLDRGSRHRTILLSGYSTIP
jgi:hypothetical protein